MQSTNAPARVPLPFANAGTKNAIPTASQIGITPGAASLNDGFPPLTFSPLAAGGVPPSGADFNGILNLMSAIDRWMCAGGMFRFDATFSTAIGGYPQGAVLLSDDLLTTYISTVDNNTNNPNATTTGWATQSGGRLLKTTIFTTSGTFTPQAFTKFVDVEMVGGGGGGGGANGGTSSGTQTVGGGGGSGAYSRSLLTSGFSGASVNLGSGGTAGTSGGGNGGTGGQSSFGALVTAPGGVGGLASGFGGPPFASAGGSGGATGVGNVVLASGSTGSVGLALGGQVIGGVGAASLLGPNGAQTVTTSAASSPGASGGYGTGGSGAAAGYSQVTGAAGSAGRPGLIIVREYA